LHIKRILASTALALAFLLPAVVAQTPFSADMILQGANRGDMATGKIYFSPPKWRMDMNIQGRQAINIFDATTKVGYMMMPAQKIYMEMHADRAIGGRPMRARPMNPENPCSEDSNMTCKKLGTETVNGRTTDKWELTPKDGNDGTLTAWIDQKLHFPIKTHGATGDEMELTNVKEATQPANLFEIPSDYRKINMGR